MTDPNHPAPNEIIRHIKQTKRARRPEEIIQGGLWERTIQAVTEPLPNYAQGLLNVADYISQAKHSNNNGCLETAFRMSFAIGRVYPELNQQAKEITDRAFQRASPESRNVMTHEGDEMIKRTFPYRKGQTPATPDLTAEELATVGTLIDELRVRQIAQGHRSK